MKNLQGRVEELHLNDKKIEGVQYLTYGWEINNKKNLISFKVYFQYGLKDGTKKSFIGQNFENKINPHRGLIYCGKDIFTIYWKEKE